MKGIRKILKKKRVIALLAVIIILVTVGAVKNVKGSQGNIITLNTQNVEFGRIESVIISKGKIDAKTSKNMIAESDGEVSEVYLKIGDEVEKGDLILSLDSKDILKRVREAELDLAIQQGLLEKLTQYDKKILELNFENATISYKAVEDDYLNKKTLYDEGAISKADYNVASNGYEQAKNKYEIDKMTYESGENKNDILVQRSRVELAKIKYRGVKEKYEAYFIKSPIKGTITYLNVKSDDTVSMGSPLVEVKDLNYMQVKLNLNEYDAQNVIVGNTVSVTSDAAKENEYKGIVTFIDSEARDESTSRGVQVSIKIEIDLEGDITGLKPGNSAQVKILADVDENAMVIPYEALYSNDKGEKIVFTVNEGIVSKHRVFTGIESDIKLQILSETINDGMHIVLNPNGDLVEGMEIVENYIDIVSENQIDSAIEGDK